MMRTPRERSERAYRAVEALLAHIHPREDASAVVATLRDRFASADAMFAADAHVLERAGLRPNDALLLSRMPEIARYTAHTRYAKRPNLARLPLASEYLMTNFAGLQVERFYMLCLDARGRLLENVFLQEGTLDSALFSLRGMLSEVVRVSPSAVVLSHNHPSHTLRPSQEDIECTRDALRALTVVGVPLLDHVIIAGRQAVSLRENGFLPPSAWLEQQIGHPLLRGWLSPDK